MAVQKGKQGTKGSKQIVEENVSTLIFYRNMAVGASGLYFVVMFLLSAFTGLSITMSIISTVVYFGSYQFMVYMSNAKFTETGQILDSGVDLNMEGGIAEHVKDLIILTAGTELLALISEWFWLLFLLAPLRGGYMIWGSVLKPWLTQSQEKQEAVDEKKQRKMDRKLKRLK